MVYFPINWTRFSPMEIQFVIGVFVLLILLIAFGFLLAHLHRRREFVRSLRALGRVTADTLALGEDQAALLEKMILAEGKLPGLRAFERHVKRMLEQGVPETTLHELRHSMRFDRVPTGRSLACSREFNPGMELSLEAGGHVCVAAVSANSETALTVRVPVEAAGAFVAGREVNVTFWREPEGRYAFKTRVRAAVGDPVTHLELEQVENLERIQHRHAVRAQVHWTLPATRVGRERDPIEILIEDISEGGMRLKRREGVRVGDVIVVAIPMSYPPMKMTLHARVLRMDDASIHCAFADLTIAEGDRLHREVMRLGAIPSHCNIRGERPNVAM